MSKSKNGFNKVIGWIVTGLVCASSIMTISTGIKNATKDKTEDTSTETAQVQVME